MKTPEYQSAIGEAMALLNQGKTIPLHLFRELVEQGYDPINLAARPSN